MKDDPHVLLFTKRQTQKVSTGQSWWLSPECQKDRAVFMAEARAHHPEMQPAPFYDKFQTQKKRNER